MESYTTLVYGRPEIDVLPYKDLFDYSSDFCESSRDSFHDMVLCWRPTALIV
jgi:alanine-alpha-ketoisovalerate/valine-pyruvate aminotransferase